MIRKRKPYNTYTKEFKLEAIRLMNESGKFRGQYTYLLQKLRSLKYAIKFYFDTPSSSI